MTIIEENDFRLIQLDRVAALTWWTVGAFSAVAYLADYAPFGFRPDIINLTAAHFHLAGLVLSTFIFCLLKKQSSPSTRTLAWASLLGMPMVAMGIVATQLGFSPVLEWMAALGFVGMAVLVSLLHLRMALKPTIPKKSRLLWGLAMGSLLVAMGLAAFYALRFYWPLAALDIPHMKIWHGTLNVFGFGWLGLEGWLYFWKQSKT